MVRAMLAALLLAMAPAVAVAQQPGAPHPTAALTWLAGSWRGPGTMFGNASQATLTVSPVLGGRFLEFSYRAGPFEGRAFYRPSGGGWQAQWFDNRGVTFPIAAQAEARALTSEWGDAATEQGRTVYRLADDGRLHVTDSVRRPDGSYRDFASHILTRAN
jgi:hypothetical protein